MTVVLCHLRFGFSRASVRLSVRPATAESAKEANRSQEELEERNKQEIKLGELLKFFGVLILLTNKI